MSLIIDPSKPMPPDERNRWVAKASWETPGCLFTPEQLDSVRNWDQVEAKDPEILEAHIRMVTAILDAQFDPDKAIKLATNGTYTSMADLLSDEARARHLRLVNRVQELAQQL